MINGKATKPFLYSLVPDPRTYDLQHSRRGCLSRQPPDIYSTRGEHAWPDNPRTSTALEESTLDPTTPGHLQHSRRGRLTRQPSDIYSTRGEHAWPDNPRTSTALEQRTLNPTTLGHLQHSSRGRLTRKPSDIYSTRAESTLPITPPSPFYYFYECRVVMTYGTFMKRPFMEHSVQPFLKWSSYFSS